MQQLLTGKKRFKEFEGSEFSVKLLGEIAVTFSGGTPSRTNPEYYNGDINWIKSG
jgi:type I restriction enzyme, S subunit